MARCQICNKTIETYSLPLSSVAAVMKQHYTTCHPEAIADPKSAKPWTARAYWITHGRAKYYDKKQLPDMRKGAPPTNP